MATKNLASIAHAAVSFGTGVFLHCLSANKSVAEAAAALGIAEHVISGILTTGSELMVHATFEDWLKTQDAFKDDAKHGLEGAVKAAYTQTFKALEKYIIDEYKIEKDNKERIFWLLFNKAPKYTSDLETVRQEFLQPLEDALKDGDTIQQMLHDNKQINPGLYLLEIIKKVTPDYYKDDALAYKTFTEEILKQFNALYPACFLHELNNNETAKTNYTIHLLHSNQSGINILIDDTKTIKSDVNDIKEALTPTKVQAPKRLTHVPFINKADVIGRNDTLAAITQQIKTDNTVLLLNGTGGIGKTTLAKLYVHEQADYYLHIAWVECSTGFTGSKS